MDLLSDNPALCKEAEDVARWYCGGDYEEVMGEPDPEKPEDVFTIHNWFGNAVTVRPRVELYSVNDFMGREMPGLAIVLDEADYVPGEQFAVLTVSFGEFIGLKNAAYIDVNNCPFAHELLEAGIAEDTGLTKSSGFCDYPLWVFDEDFLREHSNGAYEEYEQEYDAYMETAEQEEEECENQGMTMGGM